MTSPVSPSETIAKAMEGVTPGPWEAKQNAYGAAFIYGGETLTTSVGTEYKELVAGGNSHDTLKMENAAYIAACNPVAMREVLDELYALRSATLEVLNAVRGYLPPDGINAKDCLSRVIYAVDNPAINPILKKLEHDNVGA